MYPLLKLKVLSNLKCNTLSAQPLARKVIQFALFLYYKEFKFCGNEKMAGEQYCDYTSSVFFFLIFSA